MLRRGAAGVALVVMMGACGDAAVVETSVPFTLPPTTTSTTVPAVAETTTTAEFLSTTSTTEPFVPTLFCFEEPPPPYGRDGAAYEFDPNFYTHYCSASGIFVVGSANTPIEALEAAGQIVDRMFSHDPLLVSAIIRANHAVILTGLGETAGDLPEWVYEEGRTYAVDADHPGFVGTGGGLTYSVSPADDVLCMVPAEKHGSYGTANWGSVLVHELGHLVVEPAGIGSLDALFEVGSGTGAWDLRHYAMINPTEYWAEVVQVYLGQYEKRIRGFTQPRTREELRQQDPTGFDFAASVFAGATLLHYWCDVYDGPVVPLPYVDEGIEAE